YKKADHHRSAKMPENALLFIVCQIISCRFSQDCRYLSREFARRRGVLVHCGRRREGFAGSLRQLIS
ncbi:hypothetical protein ACCT02_37750, partial [Rhizobium ruizarguesonis]